MAQRRQDIDSFVRHLVVEVELPPRRPGMTAPQAIADHFNAMGVTTRKGRRWTGATVGQISQQPGRQALPFGFRKRGAR